MIHKAIYAFIDSQNLNLGVKNTITLKNGHTIQGWEIDFGQLYVYLRDVKRVAKAYIFIGYKQGNERLYQVLQEYGYILIFKPTLEREGITKGNCDAELVLHAMIQYSNYDSAIIISGDGDFGCLIEYLEQQNKLAGLGIPNKYRYSSLLRRFEKYHWYVNQLKKKLEKH